MSICESPEIEVLPPPAAENPPAWRTDSLTGGLLIVLGLMVVQRSVGFLRAILFCRWLDADQLGLWDMAFGFLMLAGPLVVLSLPGTFGRYADYYRRRGRLRAFLLQTALACALLTILGAAVIVYLRHALSTIIFGTPNHEPLVVGLAGCLLVIVAYNYAVSLFTALRTVRLASAMEFVNGVMFAVLGISLLVFRQCDASSIIFAYGGASLICVAGAGYWFLAAWKSAPAALSPDSSSAEYSIGARRGEEDGRIWRKLLPFTAWILLINVLTNLYGYADRYLILHYAPGGEVDRLAMVGQYHSARVVPLLLASLAIMISGILLPHLSHDWESVRRRRVAFRLNLFLKLSSLGLFSAASGVLAIAPLLFDVAFRGKFAGGSAALPGMLAATVWFGAATVAQQYIWCAERAPLVGIALFAGLAVNVTINLLLLPSFGLTSAVLAAMAANLAMLLWILYFVRRLGFRADRGTWILLAAPAALYFGSLPAIGALLAIIVLAFRSKMIFTRSEKIKIADRWTKYFPLRYWEAEVPAKSRDF